MRTDGLRHALAYEWSSQKNIAGALGSVGFSHSKDLEGSYKAFGNEDEFKAILDEIDATDYDEMARISNAWNLDSPQK